MDNPKLIAAEFKPSYLGDYCRDAESAGDVQKLTVNSTP